MKKKVEHLGASVTLDKRLYKTDKNIKTRMEEEVIFNIGKHIAENKDELPIRFREVEDEYSVTIIGDVMIVDNDLKHLIELIVESDNTMEILHYIQKYKTRDNGRHLKNK